MSTSLHLSKDSSGIDVDPTLYRSMIGSLLYLIASRPDISFSVGVCARYQASPKKSHLLAVKRIIKYVNETLGYGLLQRNDPEKFVNLGIDPPEGVLCYGPPGTGKTLLARAMANRTDACFIRVIGNELVKKYVGEGACLVRELFQMACSKKACIMFFDELGAIGGARFDDGVGGDNEVQRTMLEIVKQLDGFDARGNIKVLMATNRPDTLNPSVTSGSVVGAI
ncbi:26S proteasome regulatory subunit 7-like [Camellia sinensis]|uniref:26S proteasome regulatory subunit 7-like n=1 Tax=Camellia sinensis TaxID=4442 RepID=UPI001036A477|nr:26S proteasome regulatory subunit 7-like [Camellia sinensis]